MDTRVKQRFHFRGKRYFSDLSKNSLAYNDKDQSMEVSLSGYGLLAARCIKM